MYDKIIIRFGDSTLKGRNKHQFIDRLNALVEQKIANDHVVYERRPGSLLIDLRHEPHAPIVKALRRVSGLRGFSLAKTATRNPSAIADAALELLDATVKTFKVESRRADKGYPMTSPEISRRVGGEILHKNPQLTVDVHAPDATVNVDVRNNEALVYLDKMSGIGGFPVGVAGRGLLLLSGGIDSPVAGFLAMKQGIEIEALHFESSPLTSIESVQKVYDLATRLAAYAEHDRLNVHFVPFMEAHREIIEQTPESYHIVLMRRIMMKIACRLARMLKIRVLITGESVGQVSSQTLDSITVIEAASDRPVLRPLVTTDKIDIIATAEAIGTFDVSIRPFDDCCTIYVPKSPTVSPRLLYAHRYEKLFDEKRLIEAAVEQTRTLVVRTNDTVDLSAYGLSAAAALEALKGSQI